MNQIIVPENLNSVEYTQPYKLDLSHAVHRRGPITIWMTWNWITGRPVMILTPTDRRISHQRTVPCIIPMDTCWKWDEDRGDQEDANFTAAMFCGALGLDPYNIRDIFKVQSAIRDHLEELIRMPPLPEDTRRKVAEMEIHEANSGRTITKEISDNA